ncbi:MAG: 23S rRNA (pseudouridine(1915)-N(3))-methyltransferase RlmH [Pseudomonadota bacterium]
MRLTIAAVGRAGSGPESDLFETYRARAEAAGRGIALAPITLHEVDERKARSRAQQSERLLERTHGDAVVIALDERGRTCTSPDFAKSLADWRDQGRAEALFLIGGADGHEKSVRQRANVLLGFGQMVWPHMLVRVMLAEQIYRAVSILTNGPYHRA